MSPSQKCQARRNLSQHPTVQMQASVFVSFFSNHLEKIHVNRKYGRLPMILPVSRCSRRVVRSKDLIREFSNRAMFERASEVAREFDDLTEIHRELLLAKEQQASLLPIKSRYKTYISSMEKQEKLEQLDEILPGLRCAVIENLISIPE